MRQIRNQTPLQAAAAAALKTGLVLALLMACCWPNGGAVYAQVSNQYINVSPLPGGGITLDNRGKTDPRGAVYMNVPTAYTPGAGYAAVGVYYGDYDAKLDPFYNDKFGNGSAIIGLGLGAKSRVFVSAMFLSKVWDCAYNAQFMLRDETDSAPSLAVGMQDIARTEAHNRSPYVAATKRYEVCGVPCYATVGFGGGRFDDKPFGGVSASLNRHVSGIIEYDGFQANIGVVTRPFPDHGVSVLVGSNGFRSWLVGASVSIQK